MRESEKKLCELESEIRPNRYVALAMTILSIFMIAMMLMNEFNVFHVVKERMRTSVFTVLIVMEISLFASSTDTSLKSKATKYIMISCATITSAIMCVMLNFHATLILVLPMLLAAQYPSSKMSRIALICSLICAGVSPVIGYLTGMWDQAFIERLCQFLHLSVLETVVEEQMSKETAVSQIILYLSVPHMLILLAFYPLSSAIARSGEERLKNQIQVLHMSESDALTGLLNRLCFENIVDRRVESDDGNIAVVYVDANDLHRMNNEYGHDAGDRMLICIAESLKHSFGVECVYRTGGDEFISVLHGLTLMEVHARMAEVRTRVESYGYSLAMGIEYAQPPCTLRVLVNSAEAKMMIDKANYHITR